MPKTRNHGDRARRRFLAELLGLAGGTGLFGLGAVLYTEQVASKPAYAIRPPGALDEDRFQGACIRCGLCVRDCPFDTLRLATPSDDVPNGTPYFVALEVPCEMCDDIPCVAACPTGALDHSLTDIGDARMGLAVLLDHDNCLNFQGLRCDVCYRVCPLIDEAITLEVQHNQRSGRHAMFIPTVHPDACTGCGKCEEGCVLDVAAIKVLPLELALGALGGHYRWGWKERSQANDGPPGPNSGRREPVGEPGSDRASRSPMTRGEGDPGPFPGNPLHSLNSGPRP